MASFVGYRAVRLQRSSRRSSVRRKWTTSITSLRFASSRRRRRSPPVLTLIFSIRQYQALSPSRVRSACRFSSTCSNFAIRALLHWGAWRGARLVVMRLPLCRPSYGGSFPVPLGDDARLTFGVLVPFGDVER
ncbi:MAG: membrane protein insertion efficiency factor YidD [Alphaproteobacteria bacterium]|nr:membrane protein insertion efficiency factor YidD [Alphaproteobacteria bacterium]